MEIQFRLFLVLGCTHLYLFIGLIVEQFRKYKTALSLCISIILVVYYDKVAFNHNYYILKTRKQGSVGCTDLRITSL